MKRLTKRPHWIPVVAGFLKRQGKILLGQRPEGHNLAGVWEFPGGKIELGESPSQALQRELQEELGVHADVGRLLLAATHHHGDTGILLLFFEVTEWRGELRSAHHSQLRWVDPSELKSLDLPEANHRMLDQILPLIQEI